MSVLLGRLPFSSFSSLLRCAKALTKFGRGIRFQADSFQRRPSYQMGQADRLRATASGRRRYCQVKARSSAGV